MIDVENLTKTYGGARGINDVSFNVEKGEIVGFLGPNGAGKTTTMRILTGFMPATSGTASIAGHDVFEDSLNVRRRIGYLPETVPLYTDMQVPEYIRYVAGLKGLPYKQINFKVAEVMEQVGLTHMAHKFIGELSKGYRQRVGLAQALVNDPDVLILDEPTNGLDPKQIIEIRSLIGELGERRTIILSSHILPEVSMICKRVIIIDDGKIKAMDTPENLISQLHQVSRVQARLSGAEKDVLEGLKGLEGVKAVTSIGEKSAATNLYLIEFATGKGAPERISKMASEKKFDLYELSPMQMSLEDIFIKIVTKEEVHS